MKQKKKKQNFGAIKAVHAVHALLSAHKKKCTKLKVVQAKLSNCIIEIQRSCDSVNIYEGLYFSQ